MKFKVGDRITEGKDYMWSRDSWLVTHVDECTEGYQIESLSRDILLPFEYVDKVFELEREILFEETMS